MNSFSQNLAEARKKQGLSVDKIAEETKVRHHIIEAIENGDFKVMPEVYLRAFIKTYATYLKFSDSEIKSAIDKIFSKPEVSVPAQPVQSGIEKTKEVPKEKTPEKPISKVTQPKAKPPVQTAPVVDEKTRKSEEKRKQEELKKQIKEDKKREKERLKELKQEEKAKQKQEKDNEKNPPQIETAAQRTLDQESLNNIFFGNKDKKKSRTKKILQFAGLGLLVIILVFVVLVLFWPDSTAFLNKFLKEEDKLKVSGDTTLVTNKITDIQKVTLIARAIDTTSFRVHVDNQTDESITLYPGKSKLWEAYEKIDLSGVIVGSVEFTRNNELLQPFGQKGSVVRRITIYKDKVVSSSVSFENDTIPFVTPESFIKEE
jgi:transcriptional regulator with XRE-family HTH domain